MPLHVEQSVRALRADRHVLSEVTAAMSFDECRQLRDAAEASSAHYMLAENYCFFPENTLIKALVAEGRFGRLTFGEGEYVHDVRHLHRDREGRPTWRTTWQMGTSGNTYITHELGPVMQWMKVANPDERIVSVACFGTGAQSDPTLPQDDTTLTLVQLASGALVKIRLDMVSSRPEMVCYSLQGRTGVYESGRGRLTAPRLWFGEGTPGEHRDWHELDPYWEVHPVEVRDEIALAKDSGHGGGDFLTGRSFAKCLQSGAPPEIGIWDALEWTAAGLCSQLSATGGGRVVEVPDFRRELGAQEEK
jgi:predicted dehydrogenase